MSRVRKNNRTPASYQFVSKIKSKFNLEEINSLFSQFKKLNVLVIGDTIIDQYFFVIPKGRAIKDPILSVGYDYHENYAGGILAVANHISDFVNKVKLVTIIGDKEPQLDFIKSALGKNVELRTFTKKDSFTTIKKRYINSYRNVKMFKVEYMNDRPISAALTKEILKFLHDELPKYDLVVVGDFGHGFINQAIRNKLRERSKFIALNAQSNSANMGYNYFNLHPQPDFVSMSEEELRLPLSMRFEDIDEVIKTGHSTFKLNNFLVTLGKKGCIHVSKGKLFKAPAFTTSVIDTVGAGDALFAITSLFMHARANNELIPFIANCAGGIKSQYMGNKESITQDKLLDFIKGVYENEVGRV
jgi:bifunctional ADP-heptose synthase (sugar kinase/adenylyltransferase)